MCHDTLGGIDVSWYTRRNRFMIPFNVQGIRSWCQFSFWLRFKLIFVWFIIENNCHYDHIPFDFEAIRNAALCVYCGREILTLMCHDMYLRTRSSFNFCHEPHVSRSSVSMCLNVSRCVSRVSMCLTYLNVSRCKSMHDASWFPFFFLPSKMGGLHILLPRFRYA